MCPQRQCPLLQERLPLRPHRPGHSAGPPCAFYLDAPRTPELEGTETVHGTGGKLKPEEGLPA